MRTELVAYVETDFLVACAFADHRRHRQARALLDRAREGRCQLRLPYVAMFESRGALRQYVRRLRSLASDLRAALDNLYRNGASAIPVDSLRPGLQALDDYAGRDFTAELHSLLADPTIGILHPDEGVFASVEEVFARTRLGERDSFDAYILACVLRYARDLPPQQPRVFMSLNHKDFSPVGGTAGALPPVPQQVYDECRLAYVPAFSVELALRTWQAQFASV